MEITIIKKDGLPHKTNVSALARHVIEQLIKEPFINIDAKNEDTFNKIMYNVVHDAVQNLIGEKDGTS
jgi:hypothetical protein|tara:strand:- start:296 stop:499 length:204 start_codon:yes stop_codon:yes gene_type:complete